MAPSSRVRLEVLRLRDESVAQEYERELAESLGEPNDPDDPEKLWTDFKTKILKVGRLFARYSWNVRGLSDQGDLENNRGESRA